MQHKSSFLLISTFFLLLAARGCHSKLQCYVCDHCSSITTSTQLETCDESFFHSGGTELPSTMTTTEMTKETSTTPMVDTTMPMESSTTMLSTTTTAEGASETTTEMIERNSTMTMQSTQPPVPTPPIVSAAETSTALPTPPLLGTLPAMMQQMSTSNMGTLPPIMEQMSPSTMTMPEQNIHAMAAADQMMNMTSNGTNARDYMNSSDFRVRQTRHITREMMSEMMSYHCYTLQLSSNNTMNTQRGCARVSTSESVCGNLELIANNETSIKKCKYCSTNRCNGNSALGVSAVAILVAVVASFLKN